MGRFSNITTKALVLSMALLSVACGKSSFAPFEETLADNGPSIANSWMTVSANNVADGQTPAIVTIQLRTASNLAVSGVVPALQVSGTQNVIRTCTMTDANGMSTCKVFSTKAEFKTITMVSTIELLGNADFEAMNPSRSAVAIVTTGSVESWPAGYKIAATSGIMESNTAQYDASGALRAHSSILGSIISD